MGYIKILLHKYRKFISNFINSMPKVKLVLFILLDLFLSCYIVTITFLVYNQITVAATGLFFIYSFIMFNIIAYGCYRFKDKHLNISKNKGKLNPKTFAISLLISFIVLMITFMAYYPGGISPDNCRQWMQVQNFEFDNWHPAAHTLIIWLVTRICNHYAFFIFIQIIVFSIALGYLMSTLKAWGFSRKILILIEIYILINSLTRNIMMYAWKDSAMTICIMLIFTQLINIYFSDGLWLKKYINIIALSVFISITTLVRHNAVFFTLPFLGLIFFLYFEKVKQVIMLLILTAVIYSGVTGPLYSALNVNYPDNLYEESVGIPMTIMGDVMKKNPDALSEKTREFLNEIATVEQWQRVYVCGDYNSIKFAAKPAEKIKNVPVKEFIGMTIDTIKRDKQNSFLAVRELTGFVWRVNGQGQRIDVSLKGNNICYAYKDTVYNKIGRFFVSILDISVNIPVFDWFLTMTGVQMLALMLFGIYSFYKNGIKALIFVVPSVVYNMGTMLLLCGKDYRFFHFNVVITIVACIVLSVKRAN